MNQRLTLTVVSLVFTACVAGQTTHLASGSSTLAVARPDPRAVGDAWFTAIRSANTQELTKLTALPLTITWVLISDGSFVRCARSQLTSPGELFDLGGDGRSMFSSPATQVESVVMFDCAAPREGPKTVPAGLGDVSYLVDDALVSLKISAEGTVVFVSVTRNTGGD